MFNRVFKQKDESNGSSRFIRMNSGDTVKGCIVPEPYEFFSVFENGKSKAVPEGTPGSRFRFKVNFVVNENGVLTAKILEGGASIYSQMKEIHQEFDLTKTIIKITRTGEGLNTVYTVLPTKDKITDALSKQIAALKLNELGPKKDDSLVEELARESFDQSEEIPF